MGFPKIGTVEGVKCVVDSDAPTVAIESDAIWQSISASAAKWCADHADSADGVQLPTGEQINFTNAAVHIVRTGNDLRLSCFGTGGAIQLYDEQNAIQFGDWGPGSLWMINGSMRRSSAFAITATGTTQGAAFVLNVDKDMHEISGGADNTSVILGNAIAGYKKVIHNATANTKQVFPISTEAINGGSVDASVVLASGDITEFYCFVNGMWRTK